MPSTRRFPPPWTIDEANDACFIVRDKNGQALAYVYFEDETGRVAGLWQKRSPGLSSRARLLSP